MYFTDKTDFLAHYGVMGMKWGVRKQKDFYKSVKRISKSKKYDKLQKMEETAKLIKKIDKNGKIKKAIKKATSDFGKYDDELEKIEKRIRKSKNFNNNVDSQMKKDGVDPNDRHRGYWEEAELEKNKEYRKALKNLDTYLDKSIELDKKITQELLGKYSKRKIIYIDANSKKIQNAKELVQHSISSYAYLK